MVVELAVSDYLYTLCSRLEVAVTIKKESVKNWRSGPIGRYRRYDVDESVSGNGNARSMREGRRVYVLYCTEGETQGQTDRR